MVWGLDMRFLGGKRQKKITVEVKVIKSIAALRIKEGPLSKHLIIILESVK
jgi:hypothetical protein